MAQYVEFNGQTIEFPDGMAASDIESTLKSNALAVPKATATTAPATRTDKVLQGMRDPFDGGAQLLTKMLPDSVVKAGNSLNNFIADKTGLVGRLPEGGVDQQVRDAEAAYQSKRTAGGESGFDGYRAIGNIVSPANIGIAASTPAAAGLLAKSGIGAASGAVSGLLNPVTGEGDYASEKAKQVGFGGLLGGTAPMVTGAIARVISPKASVNPELQLLKKEGVEPTVGQSLGGAWNKVEEKLTSVPLLGDMIASQRSKALDQFNTAAINRATAPIGVKIEGSGQQAVAKAGDAISDAYNAAKAQLGSFAVDQQGTQQFNALAAAARNLPKNESSAWKNIMSEIGSDIPPTGQLTADAFKRIDSKLGAESARFSSSSDAYQKQLGEMLGNFRTVLTENAKRANPGAADAFKKADTAYANLVQIEGASKAGLNNQGVFTPGQFNSAIRQTDRSVRDRATARGMALNQDLGNAGQSVLGNKVPDSGTAGRVMTGLVGLGTGAAYSPVGAALGAGAVLSYTPPAQALLRGLLTSRPQSAQAIAEAARKTTPVLSPGLAQVGLGLLN